MAIQNNISSMIVGDKIPCRYTVLTSGQVGIFSELGTCTANEIPITGTATPDRLFYLIMVGYDSQGRKKLIADRNIQTGISWDTLNSAGICSGIDIFTDIECRILTGGTSATDTDNEFSKIIYESTLNGTITPKDNSIWHWNGLNTICRDTPIVSLNGSNFRCFRGISPMGSNDPMWRTSNEATIYSGFRPVMLVDDTSVPIVAIVKYMIQQDTNIFDINLANYSTPPTNISELHVVGLLTDNIIEQSGGGWDDLVNYLNLFKGTKYKILKFVRNQ